MDDDDDDDDDKEILVCCIVSVLAISAVVSVGDKEDVVVCWLVVDWLPVTVVVADAVVG